MNHDMSQYALENGPDEPRYTYCYACGGSGSVVSIQWQGLRNCAICHGDGEILVDEDEQ